jgi:hypothetical protein
MKEKIQLIEKQISVESRRIEKCGTADQYKCYTAAQRKSESELDECILSN